MMMLNDQNNAVFNRNVIMFKSGKINYSPKKTKSNDENFHKIQQKRTRIEIVDDFMVNSTKSEGWIKQISFTSKCADTLQHL